MTEALTPVERLVARDKLVVSAALTAVILASWGYLWIGAGMEMPASMSDMAMPVSPATWTPGLAATMFLMWCVMMAAMMLPSAAPVILLYAALARRSGGRGSTLLLASGYVLVWCGFSLLAVLAQWILVRQGLVEGMRSTSVSLSGGLLLMAGVYQLTPAKSVCLKKCRSPAQVLTLGWRHGPGGAWQMGLRHGLYCVGCCWAIMLLLFWGGVMNIAWIAALAGFVLFEKLASPRPALDRLIAWVMIGAGATLILVGLR
jgi:predicted metal-binding membrane protein